MSGSEGTNGHGQGRPPVLFLHGIFSRPRFLDPWAERFEAEGYECVLTTLPGRDPTDEAELRRIGLQEYFDAVLADYERLGEPPIVLGHSIGGLLAQKLAAERRCAALALLAPVPPGVLWPQLTALPHLVRLMRGIMAGRAIMPSEATLRAIPLVNLPEEEQDAVIAGLVPDSGRAFRSMTFGTPVTRVSRGEISCPVLCVSGTADRNVAGWMHRRIARRYDADTQVHDSLPHWLIAESTIDKVVPPILHWLDEHPLLGAAR